MRREPPVTGARPERPVSGRWFGAATAALGPKAASDEPQVNEGLQSKVGIFPPTRYPWSEQYSYRLFEPPLKNSKTHYELQYSLGDSF